MFGKKTDPLCGFTHKPCLRDGCMQWIHLRGTHPQTGMEVDTPGCAMALLPVLLLENAKEVRQAAGAIESQRNAVAGMAVSAAAEVIERVAQLPTFKKQSITGPHY